VLPAVRYYFYLLRLAIRHPLRDLQDFRNTVCSSCWPPAAQKTNTIHRKSRNFRQKTLKNNPKSPISNKNKEFRQLKICCILMQLWTKAGKVIKLALRDLLAKTTKLTKSVQSVLIRANQCKSVVKKQSKTLTLKNKKLNFQNFLSPY